MAKTRHGSRVGLIAGLVATAIGLFHFARPDLFEPLNRQLGFTEHTRLHVYINGAIETGIGLGIASRKARVLTGIASVAYPAYLAFNAIRAREASAP